MRVREAAALLGLIEDDTGEIDCWMGGSSHRTLAQIGSEQVASFPSLYFSGRFKPGSITPYGGATKANLVDIPIMGFDCDLPPWSGLSKEQVHGLNQETLDRYLAKMREETEKDFHQCSVPISAIIETGYGLLVIAPINESDQRSLPEIRALQSYLIEALNAASENPYVDTQANDPGTRHIRVPGTRNSKNPDRPRPVRLAAVYDCRSLALANFPEAQLRVSRPVSGTRSDLRMPIPERVRDGLIQTLSPLWTDGERHHLSVGLAGVCAKSQVDVESAMALMEDVAGNDPELVDRLKAVRDTYDAYEAGEDVAGYSILAGSLGEYAAQRITGLLDGMREANTVSFSVVSEGSTKPTDGASAPSVGFPDTCFPDWFNRYVEIFKRSTGASRDYHLGAALTYAGSYLGRSISVYQAGWLYPNLYTVLVGDTGSGKTTAMRMAHAFFTQKTAPTGSGYTFVHPMTVLHGQSTPEALYVALERSPSLMFMTDELAATIDAAHDLGSYMHGFLDHLSKLYDCPDSLTIEKVKNAIYLENPTLSILSGVTGHALEHSLRLSDAETGIANRICFVFGGASSFLANTTPESEAERSALFAELRRAKDRYSVPKGLSKSTACQDFVGDVQREWASEKAPTREANSLAQRLDTNMHKVALIYAGVCGTLVIEREHMEAAYAFVGRCIKAAQASSLEWSGSDEGRKSKVIYDTIQYLQPVSKARLVMTLKNRFGTGRVLDEIRHLRDSTIVLQDPDGTMILGKEPTT